MGRCARLVALGWLLTALTAGSLYSAAAAGAHAAVITSSPADGTPLDNSPPAVTFDLTESVLLVDGSAQLNDIDGRRFPFATQELESDGQRIVLRIADPLPDGSYLATARVVSADTHVVSLSVRFTVGDAQAGEWAAADSRQAEIDPLVVYSVKSLSYLGLVLSAGLLLAARWAWPDTVASQRFTRLYRIGAALLTAGLVGRLVVLVAEQAGGLADASGSTIATIVTTPFGVALVAAAVMSVVALVCPPSRGPIALWSSTFQAVTAITAVTLGGHGGSTEWWPFPFVVTFLHVYAVAVWLGGIAVLAAVETTDVDVGRWHRVAVGHLVLVLGAGSVLTLLQIQPASALLTTSYGLTLVVKVALVFAAVVVGYVAWRAISASTTQSRPRAVVFEAALVVLVVASTSVLSSLTPAKDSYTTNVATTLDFGDNNVLDVDVDTVRRGAQVITVESPAGETPQVGVELSSAQANVARLPVTMAVAEADGVTVWTSDGLIVPSPGQWKVTVRFDDGSGAPKLASFVYEVL